MAAVDQLSVTLVERFCIDGQLPACSDEVLVDAIVAEVLSRNEWKDQPKPVIESLERNVGAAVRRVRQRLKLASPRSQNRGFMTTGEQNLHVDLVERLIDPN